MIDSLFARMTRIVFCDVILKVPSTPETYEIIVSGKGWEGRSETHLHRRREHASETERNLLWMFLRARRRQDQQRGRNRRRRLTSRAIATSKQSPKST